MHRYYMHNHLVKVVRERDSPFCGDFSRLGEERFQFESAKRQKETPFHDNFYDITVMIL